MLQDDKPAEVTTARRRARAERAEKRVANGGKGSLGKEDWLADKRAVLHHRMRTRHKQRMSAPSRIIKLW